LAVVVSVQPHPGCANRAGRNRSTLEGMALRMEIADHRQPALSARGVSKRFGGTLALADIDFDVYRGEVVALAGENGAGKSTLVNILSGMHKPDAGTIYRDGRPVRIGSPARARSMGIATVFQGLALCENLNVPRNLFLGREPGSFWKMDEAAMEHKSATLLHQLQSTVRWPRARVGELSGGQQQTVAIARTLLGDPAIVILDEPTAALGGTQRTEVLNHIGQLRARDLGVVMISHNLEDIGAVADRVFVLRHGRNNGVFSVASSTTEEVQLAMTGSNNGRAAFGRQRTGGRHEAQHRG
jgi:D-xylose transport system ATP-binding protein